MKSPTNPYPLVNIFAVLLTSIAVCHSFICTPALYQDYLTHWNRSYTHQKPNSDFNMRFETFCHNRQNVENINLQNLTYKLDPYWQWMDKTNQQRKEIVRVQLTPQAIVAQAIPRQSVDDLRKVSITLPPSVDYRLTGDVSAVKQQGKCGCCWSFTTVGLYESWMMIKGQPEYDLSEQYLLECTTKFTKNILKRDYQSTCNGGYVDFSGELARVNGMPTQTNFPYISGNYTGSSFPTTEGICNANQTIVYARQPDVTKFVVEKNVSQDKMKQMIASGPVGALIYANDGFQALASGVYSGCPSNDQSFSKINHAVVIVGYDTNGNYIVKNSWGTGWGQNGFGVVSKNNDCGLTAYGYQYYSSASPGSGVLYYNQVNLNYGNQIKSIGLLFLIIILMLVLD